MSLLKEKEEFDKRLLDYNRLQFWATDVLESLAYALTQTDDLTARNLITQEFYHALNRRGMPNFFVQPMITNTLAKAESIVQRSRQRLSEGLKVGGYSVRS